MFKKMTELVTYLNARTKEYNEGKPTISDSEWDKLYYELVALEKESGMSLSNSPTQAVVYEAVNSLNKVKHNHKMLSLEKTKNLSELNDFLGNKKFIAMAKMDGLTCSLKYIDGELVSAETRGNGIIGEDILHNAKVINSIPKTIPYLKELVIDGEVICRKDIFSKAFEAEYKNPRNFAAGSIRLLDSKECSKRKLDFIAWDVISNIDGLTTVKDKLLRIEAYGFSIVPYCSGPAQYANDEAVSLKDMVEHLEEMSKSLHYPIDGIVFKFNDVEYGRSLGETSHHFKNAMAYKFYDSTYDTTLKTIEWTMGRTGVLTPVAVFEPIEIDGSVVERASLHNVSILNEILQVPYVGQKLQVFKANMIIPQIHSANHDENGELIEMPTICPVCGEAVVLKEDKTSKFLMCGNPDCEGKLINTLTHFCGKKGLDIKGLSKATLEKLINYGWLNSKLDIFSLRTHQIEWLRKPGFGPKSVANILDNIDKAKNTTLDKFICSLGIPLIGETASKKLAEIYPTWKEFMDSLILFDRYDEIEGFGPEMDKAISNFDYREAEKIAEILTFEKNNDIIISESEIKDKTFVITGSLQHYKNRDELKKVIESHGGKVVGSVSSKTSYLINNDVNSTSSKNVSAKKYNVPILSEEDFIKMLG